MKEAVIVSAVRTAVGKAPKGTLEKYAAGRDGRAVIKEALARVPGLGSIRDRRRDHGLRDARSGAGMNVARAAAIRAGLPVETSAMTINRFCSSGLQSIAMAADRFRTEARSDRCRRTRDDVDDSDGRSHHSSQSVPRRALSRLLFEHGSGH
jgi:acetyl-CoA acyltransferase